MQVCRKCLEVKELSLFAKNKSYKTGRATECKECAGKRAPLYRNPVRSAMWRFGISEERATQYRSATSCEICGESQVRYKAMCIDHNHTTGQLRGALCDQCNKGLGHFRDKVSLLNQAANYLLKYESLANKEET